MKHCDDQSGALFLHVDSHKPGAFALAHILSGVRAILLDIIVVVVISKSYVCVYNLLRYLPTHRFGSAYNSFGEVFFKTGIRAEAQCIPPNAC